MVQIASPLNKPQIISHVQKSLNYTPYDCHWLPQTAKFVVLGQHARGTAAIQVFEMASGDLNVLHEVRPVDYSNFNQ